MRELKRILIYGVRLKCDRCGKKSIGAIVKSKKFGWICLSCEKELMDKKIRNTSQRENKD